MTRVYLDVESYPSASLEEAEVIAVGLLVDRSEYSPSRASDWSRVEEVLLASWELGGEAGVLRRLYRVLGEVAASSRFVEVVGYNILGFDLPLIVQRTVEHGIMELAEANAYWHGRMLVRDLFQAFLPLNCMTRSGFSLGALAEAAARAGLEVPLPRGRGGDVPRLYEEGRYAGILEHLRSDLAASRALDLLYGELYRRLGPCGVKDMARELGTHP